MYSANTDTCPTSGFFSMHAPAEPTLERLRGERLVDVLIIGAGYTGLSTAVHLGEQGIQAIVLEARSIGWGASGRNFGQVVPYLKHHPEVLIKRFGPKIADRLISATGQGPDTVFDLIAKYGIECSAVRTGLIFAAHSSAGRAGLERRTRYWQQRGVPIEMKDAEETMRLVGSRYYKSCALEQRGGTINPLAYVRGLARAAIQCGASIYTNSPVIDLKRSGHGWTATTEHGVVNARSVVIATNAYTPSALWPGLRESIIPMRTYQAVSKPFSADTVANILPQGRALTDTRHLFSGMRLYPDGRLQVGLDGPAFNENGSPRLQRASRRVADVFPTLPPVEWEYQWSGWIAMAFDQTPHLHELAPGVWTGIGFSGRGIALATMMGRDLAGRVKGASDAELVFPVAPLRPRLETRFAPLLVGSLLNFYRVLDAISDARARNSAPSSR